MQRVTEAAERMRQRAVSYRRVIALVSLTSAPRRPEPSRTGSRAHRYRCLSREVLVEAGATYGVPERVLTRFLHSSPGLWERFTRSRGRSLIFLQAMMCNRLHRLRIAFGLLWRGKVWDSKGLSRTTSQWMRSGCGACSSCSSSIGAIPPSMVWC
jgi:hypothetical protein